MRSNQFIAFAAAALLVAWLFACGKYSGSSLAAGDFRVELHPIALDPEDPKRVEFAGLKLLSAFHLRSNDARFGGLSGLAIGADGRLYAVSDRGFWLSAAMHLHTSGRLLNLTQWQIAPILTPAKTAATKILTDAEALAQGPDKSFVVSFEQVHRIWRYPAPPETFAGAAVPVTLPDDALKAPSNGGLEAMTVRPDGQILAIAESLQNPDGSVRAWLINGRRSAQLSYLSEAGLMPSDAASLGNGDVLVLERRHRLPIRFAARLTRIKASHIRPGATLKGEELLRLEPPLRSDNFEGIAVTETPHGTMIFLVSDDNYFLFQRTLLLQFLLPSPGKGFD
jgi:hypothetical protein